MTYLLSVGRRIILWLVVGLGFATLCACRRVAVTDERALLSAGASLPTLQGHDQDGQLRELTLERGHPVLVYFYPKDGTPGCTKEACAFRDVWDRYHQASVSLYGVSLDDRASHQHFAAEHRIPFPLITDTDGAWAHAFGVPVKSSKAARVSFLFDSNGKLSRVYTDVDPGVHANQVLQDIARLQ